MIQVCRWIPMHADLARSMFLWFPVQSRSMRGFRTFHVKPQFAISGFSCKAAAGVLPGSSCKAAGRVFPDLCFPCECGFRASAPVPESYRHEFSFCASMCAFIRCQEHYHKSGISSTFLVFLLDFWAKSRVVLPKYFYGISVLADILGIKPYFHKKNTRNRYQIDGYW